MVNWGFEIPTLQVILPYKRLLYKRFLVYNRIHLLVALLLLPLLADAPLLLRLVLLHLLAGLPLL